MINRRRVVYVAIVLVAVVAASYVFFKLKGRGVFRADGKVNTVGVGKKEEKVTKTWSGNSLWPMFHGDLKRSGRSDNVGPYRGVVRWRYPIEGLFEASPVIGMDGTVYVGGDNSRFYAISPEGRLKWSLNTRDINRNSVSLGADGTIYLPSADRSVYAITPNGDVQWVFTTGGRVNSSPAVDSDGVIYFGCQDRHLYAVNDDGSLKWKVNVGAISASSPAIGDDGTIYIGSYDGQLYAVSKQGVVKWRFKADSGLRTTPAIGGNGVIYLGSRAGTFYAVSDEGELRWSFKVGDDIRASAAIGADGSVYFGAWNGFFYAFTADGKLRWKHKAKGPIEASAVVDGDGNIYVGALTDRIYSFSVAGRVRWSINGGMLNTAGAIGADGTLYICREHNLLAIGEPFPYVDVVDYKIKVGKLGEINFVVRLGNDADMKRDVDLKLFVKRPDGVVESIDRGGEIIKAKDVVIRKYEYAYKGDGDLFGSYIIVAKLLDGVDGGLLSVDSEVVIVK